MAFSAEEMQWADGEGVHHQWRATHCGLLSSDIWSPAMLIRMEHDNTSSEGMAPVGATVVWHR